MFRTKFWGVLSMLGLTNQIFRGGCTKVLRVEFLLIILIGLLRCHEGASVPSVLGVTNIGCDE